MSTQQNKIVLFDSNIKYIGTPLALLSITKLLDVSKYDIRIITKAEYPNYENEILKQCKDSLCFGITCVTGTPIKIVLKICQLVKQKYPSLPIILGGWQANSLPDVSLENQYIDYICIGQGETTFKEFINMIETNDFKNIDKIKGLSYKRKGVIIHNQLRDPEDLNQFPDFNLDLINWEKHLEVTDYGQKALRIVTSYGCAYSCGFCCEPFISKRRWKALSADRIINFLLNLKKIVNFDSLTIVDSNFFTDEKRVWDFCKYLINNNFKVKIGQVNGRTNELKKYKEETFALLEKSGFCQILIGAESANNEALDFINKGTTTEDTVSVVKICKRYNINLVISVMLGLPIKNYFNGNITNAFDIEFQELFNFFKDFYKVEKYNHFLIFIYTPLPNSALYNKAKELGFIPPRNLEEWSNYELTDIHVPWISKNNIKKYRMFGYITMILGVDFKYFFSSLFWPFKLLSQMIISIAKLIIKIRLKCNYLKIPIDLNIFNIILKIFNYLNKSKKISRVGG